MKMQSDDVCALCWCFSSSGQQIRGACAAAGGGTILSRGTANSVDLTHWPEEKLNLELFQETWNIELLLITLAAACCTTDQS
jgi:hypothetical protein